MISNLDADQSEQQKKDQQRYELEIRDEVRSHSTVIKEIIDCDANSCVPEDCSVTCDDNCLAIFNETDSDDKPYSTDFNPHKYEG